MRALQLSLAGTVILALLGGVGGAVMAQDEATVPGPEAATLVSGQLLRGGGPGCGDAEFTEVTVDEGILRERGRVCYGRAEMSDPRLNGEVTFMDDADRYLSGLTGEVLLMDVADPYNLFEFVEDEGFADIVWGSITIENDDGTWEGRSVGTSDNTPDGYGLTYHELVGTGAYDGLSAVLFMLEDDIGLPLTGVIFPGALTDDR